MLKDVYFKGKRERKKPHRKLRRKREGYVKMYLK